MQILQKLWAPFLGGPGAVGLLALRLLFGLGMVLHGFGKIQKPMDWMGPNAPVPGFLQFLAAFSEFFGGLAIIVGLLTPIAALGIALTMLVAIFTAHAGDPFVAQGGGKSWEGAGTYLAAMAALMLAGPGTISLDYLLFGRGRRAANDTVLAADPMR